MAIGDGGGKSCVVAVGAESGVDAVYFLRMFKERNRYVSYSGRELLGVCNEMLHDRFQRVDCDHDCTSALGMDCPFLDKSYTLCGLAEVSRISCSGSQPQYPNH